MINNRKIKHIISGLLAVVLSLCFISVSTVHADATLEIKVSSGNTEVGSSVTFKLIATGDGPYSDYQGTISYDSNLLQLSGISIGDYSNQYFSASGSNFTDFHANIPNGSVLIYAKFTCIAAGSTSVSCSLDNLADINGTSIPTSGTSTSITITTPVALSGNADLASLAISPGTLSPVFAAGTQSYSASVNAEQSKITVSALPADGKSKVTLNGVQNSLAAGSNTVKVTVTAENGTTKVYTITVTRATGPTPTPAPTPIPLPLMKYNNSDYTILTAGASDGIPEGFTAATAKYLSVDIPVLQKTLGEAADASVMTLVLLTNDAKTAYFVYDAATQTCYPYQLISSAVFSFQIMDKSAVTSVPEGYEAFDFTYLDSVVTAYRLISDPKNPQVLLNLMDGSGISAFYYYDTQSEMLMPYRGEVLIIAATPTPTSTPAPAATPAASDETFPVTAAVATLSTTSAGHVTFKSFLDFTNPVVLLVYLLILFCLVLLTVCIVLIAKKDKPLYVEADQTEPDDYQDDTFSPDTAVIAPKPEVFFNEFGKPVEDKTLYFGDKPPVEETKLDFFEIGQEHSVRPVLLPPAPSARKIQNSSPVQQIQPKQQPPMQQLPKQIPQKVQPVQRIENVPVRLRQELEAEKVQRNSENESSKTIPGKAPVNDPDFDPDDES